MTSETLTPLKRLIADLNHDKKYWGSDIVGTAYGSAIERAEALLPDEYKPIKEIIEEGERRIEEMEGAFFVTPLGREGNAAKKNALRDFINWIKEKYPDEQPGS